MFLMKNIKNVNEWFGEVAGEAIRIGSLDLFYLQRNQREVFFRASILFV